MDVKRNTLAAICLPLLLLISACKVEVSVPEGGTVASESGDNNCQEGSTCVIEIETTDFLDRFTAIPRQGYQFEGWQAGAGYLCQEGTAPCQFATSPALQDLLEFDFTFKLEPKFSKQGIAVSFLPGDPAQFRQTTSDYVLDVSGDKDANGVWETPREINYRDANGEKSISLDASGRPTSFTDDDGNQIYLEYREDGLVKWRLVSIDGQGVLTEQSGLFAAPPELFAINQAQSAVRNKVELFETHYSRPNVHQNSNSTETSSTIPNTQVNFTLQACENSSDFLSNDEWTVQYEVEQTNGKRQLLATWYQPDEKLWRRGIVDRKPLSDVEEAVIEACKFDDKVSAFPSKVCASLDVVGAICTVYTGGICGVAWVSLLDLGCGTPIPGVSLGCEIQNQILSDATLPISRIRAIATRKGDELRPARTNWVKWIEDGNTVNLSANLFVTKLEIGQIDYPTEVMLGNSYSINVPILCSSVGSKPLSPSTEIWMRVMRTERVSGTQEFSVRQLKVIKKIPGDQTSIPFDIEAAESGDTTDEISIYDDNPANPGVVPLATVTVNHTLGNCPEDYPDGTCVDRIFDEQDRLVLETPYVAFLKDGRQISNIYDYSNDCDLYTSTISYQLDERDGYSSDQCSSPLAGDFEAYYENGTAVWSRYYETENGDNYLVEESVDGIPTVSCLKDDDYSNPYFCCIGDYNYPYEEIFDPNEPEIEAGYYCSEGGKASNRPYRYPQGESPIALPSGDDDDDDGDDGFDPNNP